MTNDLDHLLEQVEDALEDGEEQLWQPDLTALVLPSPPFQAAEEAREDAIPTAPHTRDVNYELLRLLQEGQRHGDNHLEQLLDQFSAEQGVNDVQQRQHWARSYPVQSVQTRQDVPALLEKLRDFDRTLASLDALSRSQGTGNLTSRTPGRLPDTETRYDPASLGDSPLAAAAAAAREEDQARAVDRAFQRDSRRYDRGFSLY